MKILIEIPDEAGKSVKILAALEMVDMKTLHKQIYLSGLKTLSKENKQLAELLKK